MTSSDEPNSALSVSNMVPTIASTVAPCSAHHALILSPTVVTISETKSIASETVLVMVSIVSDTSHSSNLPLTKSTTSATIGATTLYRPLNASCIRCHAGSTLSWIAATRSSNTAFAGLFSQPTTRASFMPFAPSMSLSMAGSAVSDTKPIALVSAGRNAPPIFACRSPHWAAARCCLPARVSDSRPNAPCASAVCRNSRSRRA